MEDCSQQGGPRYLSLLADRLDWAPCTCSIGLTISLATPSFHPRQPALEIMWTFGRWGHTWL